MIGKNIKRFREEKGFSQEGLAEKLNVTRQAVSNWEREKTQPDIETLHNISMVLEVTIEDLIYGEDNHKGRIVIQKQSAEKIVKRGITFGTALAMVISYVNWHSIGWAIFHGLLSWGYVIYYIIRY